MRRHNSCSFSDAFNFDHLSQVIGYEDESVEIYFKDRSNLQLSPCGANFRYTRAHSGLVPSLGRKQFEVTQRCVFATSETRQKVLTSLLIRNQLCSRPYLVAEFLSEMHVEPVRGYQKLMEINWPQNSEAVLANDDGSFTVHGLKGEAMLKLYPCKHAVVACYSTSLQDYGHDDIMDGSATDGMANKPWSALQKRIFPASMCPAEWAYPLSLIESVASGNDSSIAPSRSKQTAPRSVPRKCPNQFRHFWRNFETKADDPDVAQLQEIPEFADTRIKFLWCENNLYWIHNDGDFTKIETWLKNGDIFKSHPKNERYFIHLQLVRSSKLQKLKYNERIMSSALIPNDAIMKSVMLRCIRMISYKSRTSTSVKGRNPCWESKSIAPTEACNARCSLPKANVIIPTLGVFSAVADSVEISFNDGTMVHMNVTLHEKHESKFTGKKCRIVLKDGRYFLIDDLKNPPGCVENYVMHVLAWIHWLALPNLERIQYPFYSGTMYDQNEMKRVQKELDKIGKATSQRDKDNFQYLELTGMRRVPQGPISINDVTEALSHTSKAITDIDVIINQFKKVS